MSGWAAGVYTRARNWVNDKNGAINPQAALFDQEDDTIAAGLNNCVTKDGLNKPSATMDWNGQRLTALGDAAAATDALNRQSADARYGRITVKRKATDTSRASTTAAVDDPDLLVALSASTHYAVELCILFDELTSTAGGFKLNLFYAGTVTGAAVGVGSGYTTGGVTPFQFLIQTVSGTSSLSLNTIAITGAGSNMLIVRAIILTNSAANLSLQWAQFSSSANATLVRANSYLTVTQLN